MRLLVDVRQRRGVRGSRFAWANSQRLQALLAAERIAYAHHKQLAPTTELRQLQYREDDRMGVGKRSRGVLAPDYVARYTQEILDPVDLAPLVADFPRDGRPALFCVECSAAACHRSLVTARLSREYGLRIINLKPPVDSAQTSP